MQYYVSSKINRNTNLSIILSYPQLILYTRINPQQLEQIIHE